MGRGKRPTQGSNGTVGQLSLADDLTLTVQGKDRQFVMRVIRPGERYGRNRVLVNERSEPLVSFYDAKNRFPDGDLDERVYGQMTGGQYLLSSLLDHNPDCNLVLHGGVPVWVVPAAAMEEVHAFLLRQLPKPPRGRLSGLAERRDGPTALC